MGVHQSYEIQHFWTKLLEKSFEIFKKGGGIKSVQTSTLSFSPRFSLEVAQRFHTSRREGTPGVIWTVHVDPAGKDDMSKRCANANYVEKAHVPGEEEYLFAVSRSCLLVAPQAALLAPPLRGRENRVVGRNYGSRVEWAMDPWIRTHEGPPFGSAILITVVKSSPGENVESL